MEIIIVKDYKEVSRTAADYFIKLLKEKPNATLGLATGSSPIGLYGELVDAFNRGEISFKDVTTVNLDEYVGLSGEHDQSYRYFMNKNLFDQVDINKNNTFVPCGIGEEPERNAEEYNELLKDHQQDIQLLGIGKNGHIGFNEPGTPFDSLTHIVELTENTRNANARFFESIEEVPTHAITMGIANVMNAKTIILVATGTEKAQAIYDMIIAPVSNECPASALRDHPNAIVILDENAASML